MKNREAYAASPVCINIINSLYRIVVDNRRRYDSITIKGKKIVVINMILHNIISFFQIINWNSIVSFIFGALITAIISYIFTKHRENRNLKISLQIKTTDIILDSIKHFLTCSTKLSAFDFSFFIIYNTNVHFNQKRISAGNSETMDFINEMWKDILESSKGNIRKGIENYIGIWKTYFESFFEILSIMESREVILHKFVGIRNLMQDRVMILSAFENDFILSHYKDIENFFYASQQIDQPFLDMITKYQMDSQREIVNILAIVADLKNGLQNEFLSKLFRYNVPIRQPADKTLPVYKPGFIYVSEKDSSKNTSGDD